MSTKGTTPQTLTRAEKEQLLKELRGSIQKSHKDLKSEMDVLERTLAKPGDAPVADLTVVRQRAHNLAQRADQLQKLTGRYRDAIERRIRT